MNTPNFWDDVDNANKVNQELINLKKSVSSYNKLNNSISLIKEVIETNDVDLISEVTNEYHEHKYPAFKIAVYNVPDELNVSINELLLIASEYKVSLNAVIMRLCNLGIIDENQKRNLFIFLTRMGIKNKQLQIVDEHPTRERKLIYRLEAEKIISSDEAIKYLGVTTDEYFKSDFSS